MAIVLTDFDKIWSSTSPLTPYTFSNSNYQEGWNFIGSTPPARQMWDSIQKFNDEKMKYIVDNFSIASSSSVNNADFRTQNVTEYALIVRKSNNIVSLLQYVSDSATHSTGDLLFTVKTDFLPLGDVRIPFSGQNASVNGYLKISSADGKCTVDAINNNSISCRLCVGGAMWFIA